MRDIEELKKKLGIKYPFFSCPKKADRIFLTDQEWAAIDWTPEELELNIALPKKLYNSRHDDHLWPWCHKFRGEDAYGPRAPRDHPKFLSSPPKLIKGYSIQRWVKSDPESIVRIESFMNKWIMEKDLPDRIEAIEMNPSQPDYKQKKVIRLHEYAPSILQKFSKCHYLVCKPPHISWHFIIRDRGEFPFEDGGSFKLFYRRGMRFDGYDNYYIKSGFYMGPNWC